MQCRDLTHGSCRRSCPRWPPSLWAAAASPRDARGRRGGTWLWIATTWKVKRHGKKAFRTYLKVHFADWAFCDEVVVVILDNLAKACLSFLIWFKKIIIFSDLLCSPLWRRSWCSWRCRQSPWTSVSVWPLCCPWWGSARYFNCCALNYSSQRWSRRGWRIIIFGHNC